VSGSCCNSNKKVPALWLSKFFARIPSVNHAYVIPVTIFFVSDLTNEGQLILNLRETVTVGGIDRTKARNGSVSVTCPSQPPPSVI